MTIQMSRRRLRITVLGIVAGALFVSWPSPVATAEVRAPSVRIGNTYGGVTAQGMPVVVTMTSTRREVVRTLAALELTCTSGNDAITPDRYTRLPVSRRGKFHFSFGPITQRNDDGTTTDLSGRIAGALNDSKTRITGVSRFIAAEHDLTGAVTDTCDSGLVSWTAKQ